MKVAIVNHSDISGGAARAAYRIHHALRRYGVDSKMLVNDRRTGDWTVEGPQKKWQKFLNIFRPQVGSLLTKTLTTGNPITHSPAVLSSRWPTKLNQFDADVLHLHWVHSEMLSISDIGRLRKPVVWTLHDMWAFCGAEHYTQDSRWKAGYTKFNRPDHEHGVDINRLTWQRKKKHWKKVQIVAPSNWLADCVRNSALMGDWPVAVVPNAIDTANWKPVDKRLARQLLGLPVDAPLLLFGAMGGARDPRKGFDLLQNAFDHLRGQLAGLELVVFGQMAPKVSVDVGFPVHYFGHLHDDISLRLLYSSADAIVIPSRQDNLPNAGVEAHACGTPVIAFETCGLSDIVQHRQTGYLAQPFEVEDLASGIQWVLSDTERNLALRRAARQRALDLWSFEVVAPKYEAVYKKAMAG